MSFLFTALHHCCNKNKKQKTRIHKFEEVFLNIKHVPSAVGLPSCSGGKHTYIASKKMQMNHNRRQILLLPARRWLLGSLQHGLNQQQLQQSHKFSQPRVCSFISLITRHPNNTLLHLDVWFVRIAQQFICQSWVSVAAAPCEHLSFWLIQLLGCWETIEPRIRKTGTEVVSARLPLRR